MRPPAKREVHAAAGDEKRYRGVKYSCVDCPPKMPQRIMEALYPPRCARCNRKHNNAPSTDPVHIEAKGRETRRLARTTRTQPLINGVHTTHAVTRAASMRGIDTMTGVIAVYSSASMAGSQFKGPQFKHLFGCDIDEHFGPSFMCNNDSGAFEKMDLLEVTKAEFRALLVKHKADRFNRLLILPTLDCSLASAANGKAKPEEKESFYRLAVAKLAEIFEEAEKTHLVSAFWEFLNDAFVKEIIRSTFPEATLIELKGSILEDRDRAYFLHRFDKGAHLFREELAKRTAPHVDLCVADVLEERGFDVSKECELHQLCWSWRQRRLDNQGRDPRTRRAPTITTRGLMLLYRGVREVGPDIYEDTPEIRLSPEDLLALRSIGADFPFTFAPGDSDKTKRNIVGMGVSLVVAAAARAAFERCSRG